MEDKTLIARPTSSLTEGEDETIFIQRNGVKKNDDSSSLTRFMPISGAVEVKAGVQPAGPGLIPSAAMDSNADATQIVSTNQVGMPVAPPLQNSNTAAKTVIKRRFELDILLGAGGMGAVYKALDRRKLEANDSEPYVAIKLLNDEFGKHPDAFIALQREARKSQTLAHPNIVTVYDFDREGARVFMTMEFLSGSPLDKLLRQHTGVGLVFEKAYEILEDISKALIYAHSHGIVHSDFKPGNIFVTQKKGSKVFDFGIARAVSGGGVGGRVGETTIFDASTLGALTPAYASLEMLKGAEPAPSDDVFALACVAYELFCGSHPYNKIPADQALVKKLKPKRIKALSRRQWSALKAALALRREDRISTVEGFVQHFFGSARLKWMLGGIFAALIFGVVVGYNYLQQKNAAEQRLAKAQLEQQLAADLLKRRIADKQETIDRLIRLSVLTSAWETDIRAELKEYSALDASGSEFIDTAEQRVAELFVAAATGQLNLGNLDLADTMLARTNDWHPATNGVEALQSKLVKQRQILQQRLIRERKEAEKAAERERQQALSAQRRLALKKRQRQIDTILDEMGQTLRCSFELNLAGVEPLLKRLKRLDANKEAKLRPIVAAELNDCLIRLAAQNPLRTEPLLKRAQTLLPEQQVLQTFTLDFCAHLSPGSGGKGKRYNCVDHLSGGGKSPVLVVVKGANRKRLAIGKYEVSNGEFKHYCRSSGQCADLRLGPDSLPVTNITITQAQAYLTWLSQESGKLYRLPTEREWFAAASANGQREVADRNCHLKYRGIEKGLELVSVNSGSGNSFGLFHTSGNVQEWGLGLEGKLLALGGSRIDPMSRCLATTKRLHDGGSDKLTGFRIVRNIK